MKRSHLAKSSLIAAALLCMGGAAHAQISLQSAVNLALKNSPRVRAAQADVDKAKAAKSEARDAYIPTVSTTAGYGKSTGAPLDVPVIFSISANSLVFSFSQRDIIRSTNEALKATELALHNVEVGVVEDTTNTYLALDYAIERHAVLSQSSQYADNLVTVTSDRISLGVDPKVELPKSHRTATQIRLQMLQVEDDMAANRQHLAQLTGLPANGLMTDRNSIPEYRGSLTPSPQDVNDTPDNDGIKAAFATARSKMYIAFADRRYVLRPQVVLSANYSRVDTGLSSYAAYYPRYGAADNSQNSLGFGVQFTLPLMDMAHQAKARGSAADAARAFADADQQRAVFREGQAKLRNAARELDLRTQLARDDREIAQDQLETMELQLNQQNSNSQGPQLTPKDRLNAQLQERQKYLDVLAADLQLRQTQVSLMRQTNTLGDWILHADSSNSVTATPTTPETDASTPAPAPAAPSSAPRR